MRRVLLLITDLLVGGLPTIVRGLASRLRDHSGAHVEVACLAPWGPVADQIEATGIRVTALGAKGPGDVAAIARLVSLIGQRRFDTVLSFLVHANVAAAIAATWRPEVRHFQCIQTTQPTPRWHWHAQAAAHWMAEKLIAPSESVATVLRDWSGVPREKIVIIQNAVDGEAFPVLPLPPGDAPYSIGFIGRLDPIKRIPDLLHAVKLLKGFVRLNVFGDGEQRVRLQEEVRGLGIEPSVTLHGSIARPQDALAQISLLVLPSQAEGLPMVLLEAMASGVPVVATDVPGIRDVVRDGRTGLLVPVGSPPHLAATIRRVLSDDRLKQTLVAAAREDVLKRFTWEAVVRRYARLLEL